MRKTVSSIITIGLLQLVFFGAGYLRLKQWRRFAITWSSTLAVLLIVPVAFPPRSFQFTAPIVFLLVIALTVIFAIDVMRLRYRLPTGQNIELLSWWKIVIFIFVLEATTTIVTSVASPLVPSLIGSSAFKVKTIGMSPTINRNEYIIVDIWAYKNALPVVGDVVTASNSLGERSVVARVRKIDSVEALLTLDNSAWVGEEVLTIPVTDIRGKAVSIWLSNDLSRIGQLIK